MEIANNSVGNYKPIITQKNNNISKAQSKKVKEDVKITKDERVFFTKLYPEEKDQITNYHFYNKEGDKNGVSLGSLFDRRG